MINLVKRLIQKENKELLVGETIAYGYCEWGELHYFDIKKTKGFSEDSCSYNLYIEEATQVEGRFSITFTGTLKDILSTLEAIDYIYVVDGEEG